MGKQSSKFRGNLKREGTGVTKSNFDSMIQNRCLEVTGEQRRLVTVKKKHFISKIVKIYLSVAISLWGF